MTKKYFAAAVFLGSFLVYAFTAPRHIYLEDNAEFITAGKVLGIAHPPGYPVFVILAKFFSVLPLGSTPFRVNILSAVFAGAGLTFFYLILRRAYAHIGVGESHLDLISALTSLALGFSGIFWSQSIVAETYILNFFFLSLIVWLFLRFTETKQKQYFLWASLLFGLGFGNHQMLVLFLPVLAAAFLFYHKDLSYRTWIAGGLLFALGLSIYVFLPIRSAMNPALDWGATHTSAKYFFYHVLRLGYGDLGGRFQFADKLKFFGDFFLQIWAQFSFGLILAGLGLFSLVKRGKKIILFSAAILLANTLGIILLRGLPFSEINSYVYTVYYLPAYVVVVTWMGFGVNALASRIKFLAPAALGLAVLALGVVNFQANNLKAFTFLDSYSSQLLDSLEPNAVLLLSLEGLNVDNINFSLLYQKIVARKRPDVTVVSLPNIFKSPDRSSLNKIYRGDDLPRERKSLAEYALAKEDFENRPLYATFPMENLSLPEELTSRSNGLVYRIYRPEEKVILPQYVGLMPSARDKRILEQSLFGQDFLANLAYTEAAWYAAAGDKTASQKLLVEAIKYDNEPNGLDYSTYLLFREKVLLSKEKQSEVSGSRIQKSE